MRFKNNGKWALTFLLDLQPVKDYIEENKPEVDDDDDEDLFGSDDDDDDDEDEDLDIDEDLFGSDDDDEEFKETGAAGPVGSEDDSTIASFSMGEEGCKSCCVCGKLASQGFTTYTDEKEPTPVCICKRESCFSKYLFQ